MTAELEELMNSEGNKNMAMTASRNRAQGKNAVVALRTGGESAQENLTRAFLTFTQAASSLERSYAQLQGEVARLHQELERANAELDRTLEENAQVRAYLAKLLEHLPCGVLAANESGQIQLLNPEARRLLGVAQDAETASTSELQQEVQGLLEVNSASGRKSEREISVNTERGNRVIGILRESMSGNGAGEESIWILRDLTEQRRTAAEREAARRSQALAEVATVLAHEIRNPLGSMELFTGLLADASAHLPETRQWITHLRAGLRALSSTLSDVVTALTRAISIGTEGANGTLNATDQQDVAQEVQGIQQQIAGLANTTYQGTYIFSGTDVTTQPFTVDPTTGAATYNGNNNANPVQLFNGTFVNSGVPGNQLFQNASGSVFGSLQALYTSLQSGNVNNIASAVNQVQNALSQVGVQRVFYGNALNQMSSSENFLSQDKINLSTQENTLVAVNPAVAATNFSQSQLAYEGELQATSQVLNLPTLLDFLK